MIRIDIQRHSILGSKCPLCGEFIIESNTSQGSKIVGHLRDIHKAKEENFIVKLTYKQEVTYA